MIRGGVNRVPNWGPQWLMSTIRKPLTCGFTVSLDPPSDHAWARVHHAQCPRRQDVPEGPPRKRTRRDATSTPKRRLLTATNMEPFTPFHPSAHTWAATSSGTTERKAGIAPATGCGSPMAGRDPRPGVTPPKEASTGDPGVVTHHDVEAEILQGLCTTRRGGHPPRMSA